MKRLLRALLATGIGIAGCDYAKPTDIDRLERDIEQLGSKIDSLSRDTSGDIDSLGTQVDSLASDISAQSDALQRFTEKLDTISKGISATNLALAMGGLSMPVISGPLPRGESVERDLPLGERHAYELILEKPAVVKIDLKTAFDGVLIIMKVGEGASLVGSMDQDGYADGFDHSFYAGELEAGSYVIVVSSYDDSEREGGHYILSADIFDSTDSGSPFSGKWTGEKTITQAGDCSIDGGTSSSVPVVMIWTVSDAGDIEILELSGGTVTGWTGKVGPDLDISLQKTYEISCGGEARSDTVLYQGRIEQEEGIYYLKVESTEEWCPDYGCVFRVAYSISKSA